MGFFTNRSVNFLNLHNGFAELLTQVVFLFGTLYLYQHGFSVAAIFFILGLMAAGRICCRLLALPLIKTLGLRGTVALGMAGYGASVLLLSRVEGIDGWFIAYLTLYVLFNPVYWLCFHIYYTLMSEKEHRGKQYAVRSSMILGGQALFPLIGAAIVRWFGYGWYFALAVPITLCALFFLFLCPNVQVPGRSWAWARKEWKTVGVRTSIFRSFYELSCGTLWMFTLLQFFGGKLVSYGGTVTFGIIAQVLLQLFIGHRLDKGHAVRIANTGGVLLCATFLGRVFMPLSLPVILGLELCNSAARMHMGSVTDIATYNDSHTANHIVWYWIMTETTRDLGNCMGTWCAALLLYCGADMRLCMLAALPALFMLWRVLRNVLGVNNN